MSHNDIYVQTMLSWVLISFNTKILTPKCQSWYVLGGWGWGHLYLKLDLFLVKKNPVIRVVFQDQAMYTRTSFRGAKTCKIGKKGCVFGHIDKFWKEHDGQIKKNTCKNAY